MTVQMSAHSEYIEPRVSTKQATSGWVVLGVIVAAVVLCVFLWTDYFKKACERATSCKTRACARSGQKRKCTGVTQAACCAAQDVASYVSDTFDRITKFIKSVAVTIVEALGGGYALKFGLKRLLKGGPDKPKTDAKENAEETNAKENAEETNVKENAEETNAQESNPEETGDAGGDVGFETSEVSMSEATGEGGDLLGGIADVLETGAKAW